MNDETIIAVGFYVMLTIVATIVISISWIGFNFYYDKLSCVKYTDNGVRCIERRVVDNE